MGYGPEDRWTPMMEMYDYACGSYSEDEETIIRQMSKFPGMHGMRHAFGVTKNNHYHD